MMGRRSEEHTSELQSQSNLVCRLLLEKKNAVAQEKLVVSDDWLFQSGMNRKAEPHRLYSNADVNGTLAPLQKLFACACEHFFAVNTHPLSAENLPPAKLPQASTACELIILSSSPRTPAASSESRPDSTANMEVNLERLCICGGNPPTFSPTNWHQRPHVPAFFDANFPPRAGGGLTPGITLPASRFSALLLAQSGVKP